MTDNVKSEEAPKKRSLCLKFEYEGQQYELSSLTTDDTAGDLRAVICSMLNIDDFDRINLKTLQPTRVIDSSDDAKKLSEIFSQPRERIIVEEAVQSRDATLSTRASLQSSSTSNLYNDEINRQKPKIKSFKSDHHPQNTNSMNQEELNRGFPNVDNPDLAHIESNTSQPSNLQHDQSHQQLSTHSTNSQTESPIRQRKLPKDQNDYPVCSSTGYLLRHPVPSNNSCLFISVHFCLTNGLVDDQIGRSMRRIIADTVASDKERFDDAFLGQSSADYCSWILDDNNWGGAIELSILCKYYETEIVAIDVKNTILNRFGEDSHYPQRMLLLYDGLHYDPLKFQPLDDSQQVKTLFSAENLEVLTLAEELAKEAKQSHQFTDINTITMKCTICNMDLDAKTAPEHAAKTGHVDFVEIS